MIQQGAVKIDGKRVADRRMLDHHIVPAGQPGPLALSGALAAFCGVMLGKRYLHKVTMRSVRLLVGAMLFGVGFALLTGLL